MTRAQDIARLTALAAMVRDARLARLKSVMAECTELRARIRQLDTARRQIAGAESFCTAPAYLLWQMRARADLNTRLAAAFAREEHARAAARQAVGRAEVLAQLEARVAGGRGGGRKTGDQAS